MSSENAMKDPEPPTFKPCVIINDEAGITEAVFEDVPYIAEPVFEGVYHWMDRHVAMDDGRLVGFAVWKTAPATEQRETVSDAQPKRWLIEEILPSGSIRWCVVEHEQHARDLAALSVRETRVTPLWVLANV